MINRLALLAALMALSGCATSEGGSKSFLASGAKPSGPVQVAVASKIISSMEGGLIGGSIGSGLGETDRRTGLQAEYRALEYMNAGDGVDWKSASIDASGQVTAAQPYRVGSQNCRQYSHTVSQNGQKQTARGTACRNPDGSWTPLT